MAPVPLSKATGGQLSPAKRAQLAATATPSTPRRSPIKQRKAGVTLQQKKTLIENMRLEITERARRLRAQYHLQAQGLRSRIEIRLNRIPMSLRKLKMEDLLLKYMEQGQEQQPRATNTRTQPAQSPLKDGSSRASPQKQFQQVARTQNAGRLQKHSSDKENDVEQGENAKRRAVGNPGRAVSITQVLSPTSSNTRMANRERIASPTKSHLLKASSPIKFHGGVRPDASNSSLSSAVEKGKGPRAGGIRKITPGSASSGSATSRPKRAAAAAPRPAGPRSMTRTTRRASGNSDTSESSTNTMVRKFVGGNGAAALTKKATEVGGKGVAGIEEKISDAAQVKSTTGRMLRKRG